MRSLGLSLPVVVIVVSQCKLKMCSRSNLVYLVHNI